MFSENCYQPNDIELGIDFGPVWPNETGLDPDIYHRASPSGNSYLISLLKDMNVTAGDSILDIGCAKGSAMRVMLEFPFSVIEGIEVYEPLAQIARDNFRKLKTNKCVIHVGDAVDFSFYGLFNFFYLYNPFPCQIMKRVIDAINQSVGDREVIIIYNNPICHSTIIESGWHKAREYPDEWGNGIFVYTNKPLEQSRLT